MRRRIRRERDFLDGTTVNFYKKSQAGSFEEVGGKKDTRGDQRVIFFWFFGRRRLGQKESERKKLSEGDKQGKGKQNRKMSRNNQKR